MRHQPAPRCAPRPTRLLFGMLNSVTEWYRREGALRAPELTDAIFRIAFEGLE
ncbi:MAG TPA: hypothetical protein VN867_01190 [Candidatus Binataceae bacterium]|nr:hypothetical protein [Candidatus Binataceae bacterium]